MNVYWWVNKPWAQRYVPDWLRAAACRRFYVPRFIDACYAFLHVMNPPLHRWTFYTAPDCYPCCGRPDGYVCLGCGEWSPNEPVPSRVTGDWARSEVGEIWG